MSDPRESERITVLLFEGFELLDVFGPVEVLAGQFAIDFAGPSNSPVRSAQGTLSVDYSYKNAPLPDVVLVPGGIGTRDLVKDPTFLAWLRNWASTASCVTSVCTGSGLLAAAGLLDGYRATSNKRAFRWAVEQSELVEWVPQARWVEDRDRWTSSGVAAGIDMALGLLGNRFGEDVAQSIADRIEIEWHNDPTWDPFAKRADLSDGIL